MCKMQNLQRRTQPVYRSVEAQSLPVTSWLVYYVVFNNIYECHLTSPQLTMRCHHKAPCRMIRGSAASDLQFAYFAPEGSYSVYSYECNTEKWKELASCQYSKSALVIIDGQLTTLGGFESGSGYTNKLLTLRQRRWVEEYPPMKTARSSPAAVSTHDYVIVIGGWIGDIIGTVELYQVVTRQWYGLTNLPQPLTFPSAAICRNRVHVIGGTAFCSRAKGYSCSLQALQSRDELQSIPHLISWKSLPRLPVTNSTASTLRGQLVIIGGKRGKSRVNSIHQLKEGQWVNICAMDSSRWGCLSVSPSADRVMIVGGWGAQCKVEECVAYPNCVHS